MYLVATPIGDYLQDMSVAAIRALGAVGHVFVEADDRRLAELRLHGIIGRHEQQLYLLGEGPQLERAAALIAAGEPFAILASSGIPCFLDPGHEIVRLCLDEHAAEVQLVPVGLSSALDAALCLAGQPLELFHFNGHYPEHYAMEPAAPEMALIYFIRGPAVRAFVQEIRERISDWRRLVLLKDVRKKGRTQLLVLRPDALDRSGSLPDGEDVDYTCVVDRSRRPAGESR